MEAEIRLMLPQAKEHVELSKAGKARKDLLPGLMEGVWL